MNFSFFFFSFFLFLICFQFFSFIFSHFSQIEPLDFFKIVLFMKEVKAKFTLNSKHRSLMLTSSISITKNFNFIEEYEFGALSKYMDFLSFMQVFVDSTPDYLTINEALQARRHSNVIDKIDRLIRSGVPSLKLILGVHFGGPELLTNLNAVNQASKVNEILGYNSICELLSTNEKSKWEKLYYSDADLAILKNNKENRVIVFESSRSIANKMKVIVEKKMAGVIITSITADDYLGKCDVDQDTFDDFKIKEETSKKVNWQNEKTFPLLRTINKAIAVLTDDNAVGEQFEGIPDSIQNQESGQNAANSNVLDLSESKPIGTIITDSNADLRPGSVSNSRPVSELDSDNVNSNPNSNAISNELEPAKNEAPNTNSDEPSPDVTPDNSASNALLVSHFIIFISIKFLLFSRIF